MVKVVSVKYICGTYKSHKAASQLIKRFRNRLPLHASAELAEICGYLITDGFIDVRKYYNSKKYSIVGYISKYKRELQNFDELVFKVFGVNGKIQDWGIRTSGTSYGYIISNSFVTRTLVLCGVP